MEEGESDHHGAGRLGGGGGQAGPDTELLFQQLPRSLQSPRGSIIRFKCMTTDNKIDYEMVDLLLEVVVLVKFHRVKFFVCN